jgi:hypothetical protein
MVRFGYSYNMAVGIEDQEKMGTMWPCEGVPRNASRTGAPRHYQS